MRELDLSDLFFIIILFILLQKVFMSLLSKKRKLLELREVVMLKSPRNRLLGEKGEKL